VGRQMRMKWGLLWFDDNPRRTLSAKVKEAAQRYREKFGTSPDVCYVHPMTLLAAKALPERVELIELASIPPNHFWIGVRSPSPGCGTGH